ncbi:MAG: ParA family protein [Spirochaetaceae bacterium]
MERLSRSVAVASGKGGVGKSTTALNLAVHYAKSGLRVGLADLDPLSNLATILDIDEETFDYTPEEVRRRGLSVSEFVYPVTERLDLLFPKPTERSEDSIAMRRLLFRHLRAQIEKRYDIVLLDMPAGIDHEENLAFLPLVESIVVVVQPEPTSHVSAGGYIRSALDVAPYAGVLLWHNKYAPTGEGAFDPQAVVSNFNRYAEPRHRITRAEAMRIVDIAFVPHDPALDLLQTRFSFEATLYHRMLGMLDLLVEELTPALTTVDGRNTPARSLLRRQLVRHEGTEEVESTVRRLESYLGELRETGFLNASAGSPGEVEVLSDEERSSLADYIARLRSDAVRSAIVRARDLARQLLESWNEETRERRDARGRALESRTVAALKLLGGEERRSRPSVRNAAGCLLMYVGVHKLLRSHRIRSLLRAFVPVRRDEQGKVVRDRYRQIRSLIERDDEYHRRFFELVKRFFPVVMKQMQKLVRAEGLSAVVLRSTMGEVHRSAYLKLLTSWMHDTANSGLGISVGLAHTTAARAIEDGARALVESLEWGSGDDGSGREAGHAPEAAGRSGGADGKAVGVSEHNGL